MKKKFLTFILSICFIIPCMFMFSACSTTTPADIEFKIENGYIQYYDGSNWNNLIAIEELEGEDGDNGRDGEDADIWTIGSDGYWYRNGVKTDSKATGSAGEKGNGIKSIAPSTDPEKTNATQTTYIISFDDNTTYEFVVKNGTNGTNGTDGEDGKDATYSTYTITYDYGKASDLFEDTIASTTIKSTDWLTTLPEIKEDYENSFLGWYIAGTNKLVENYDFIGGNITLEARFDAEKLGLSGFYQQGKYIMTWNDLLEAYPDAFTLENSQIKGDSISNSYFKALYGEMIIDKSITSIGYEAFSQCDNITNVIIPNTVTTIESYGFAYCDLLTDIKLPDSILTIGTNAFNGCKKLETIKISSNLQSIGNNAFTSCESLTEIEIPNSVTTMGWYVFSGCDKISSITIPENLKQIDSGTFAGMTGVTTINFNAISLTDLTREDLNSSDIFSGIGYNVDVVTINIGPKVERIPSYLFDMFYTFSGSSNYSDYDTKFVVNFKNAINCQSIGTSAFSHLETVDTMILSNHIKSIEDCAFGYWYELTDIYFYGTEEEWNSIDIGETDENFTNATKYYYSAIASSDDGNYWHYDVDGITPIAW